MALPVRTQLAAAAARLAGGLSLRLGAGGGSVIGGRAALLVDPAALEHLAAGRRVALVTGTNGKTTTTRLLASALSAGGPVASNSAGANLLPGLVAALAQDRSGSGSAVALEVDEALLGPAAAATGAEVAVLLNLSRDQLDRAGEVRRHADRWRQALAATPGTRVVANADDPLVAWSAWEAAEQGRVTWVRTGSRWQEDAATCPDCEGRIDWPDEGGWACSACSLARPGPQWSVEGDVLALPGEQRARIDLRLPGQFNRANAAMAAAAASLLGVEVQDALDAMTAVETVAGRYSQVTVGGSRVRLLLAKNPAGWEEALDLIRPSPLPVVIGINARVPDGRDPSWLWDVPFERLKGRPVVATGDRARDLSVRLRYAEVDHQCVTGYRAAVGAAGGPEVDLAANYTSFQDARKELGRGR